MSFGIFANVTSIDDILFQEVNALGLRSASSDGVDADDAINNATKTETTVAPDDETSLFVYPMAVSINAIVFTTFIAFLTIVGNLVVLLAFFLERPLRENCSYYIIVSLALSDLLLGVVSPVQKTLNMALGWWPFGQMYCEFWHVVTNSAMMISQTNAFLISIDRFFSVKSPNKYQVWRTRLKMLLVIFFVWAFWIGFMIFVRIYWTEDNSPDWSIDRPNCLLRLNRIVRVAIYFFYFFFRLIMTAVIYRYLRKAASELNVRYVTRNSMATLKVGETFRLKPLEEENNSNQSLWILTSEDGRCGGSDRQTTGLGDRLVAASRSDKDNLRGNFNNIDTHNANQGFELEKGDHEIKDLRNDKGMGLADSKGAPPYPGDTNPIALADISVININNSSRGSSSDRTSDANPIADSERKSSQKDPDVHREKKQSTVDPPFRKSVAVPDAAPNTSTGASFMGPADTTGEQAVSERRKPDASRTVRFLLVANVISYGPFACATAVTTFLGLNWPSYVFYILLTMMYINSCLNPLIYAMVDPLTGATVRRIFRCHCHRNRSAETGEGGRT